jgi:hypothetical protein
VYLEDESGDDDEVSIIVTEEVKDNAVSREVSGGDDISEQQNNYGVISSSGRREMDGVDYGIRQVEYVDKYLPTIDEAPHYFDVKGEREIIFMIKRTDGRRIGRIRKSQLLNDLNLLGRDHDVKHSYGMSYILEELRKDIGVGFIYNLYIEANLFNHNMYYMGFPYRYNIIIWRRVCILMSIVSFFLSLIVGNGGVSVMNVFISCIIIIIVIINEDETTKGIYRINKFCRKYGLRFEVDHFKKRKECGCVCCGL